MKRNPQNEEIQNKSSADIKTTKETGKTSQKNSESLRKVFEEELKDIYGAEKQLIIALPEMAREAHTEELKQAFEDHLEETKEHAKRIEKIFGLLSLDREAKKCKAMAGLIEEGKDIIKDFEKGSARDSALIIGAQKIEHYEIAAYGSLCELAEVMGKHQIANILDTTLEEEEEADSLLTSISETVNDNAFNDTDSEYENKEKETEELEEATA